MGGINITEQPVVSTNQSGETGRLYYAMPVVQIVNRELATLEDLQKTLQEMGLNSGTALLRLKMRPTEIPLEEALEKISGFTPAVAPLSATLTELAPVSPPLSSPQSAFIIEGEPSSSGDTGIRDTGIGPISSIEIDPPAAPTPPTEPAPPTLTIIEPSRNPSQPRAVTVFAPAQSTLPEAAKCMTVFCPTPLISP